MKLNISEEDTIITIGEIQYQLQHDKLWTLYNVTTGKKIKWEKTPIKKIKNKLVALIKTI